MYKRPRGEHAVQSKERVYLVRVTMRSHGEHAAWATTEYHQHKRSRGELAVRNWERVGESTSVFFLVESVTGVLVKSVSLSFTWGRERQRTTYTAATEVVSVASPLFSRGAARCCRAVAAPRVRPLGARAREIQITLIPQQLQNPNSREMRVPDRRESHADGRDKAGL